MENILGKAMKGLGELFKPKTTAVKLQAPTNANKDIYIEMKGIPFEVAVPQLESLFREFKEKYVKQSQA